MNQISCLPFHAHSIKLILGQAMIFRLTISFLLTMGGNLHAAVAITTQPQSQTTTLGRGAVFSVVATGNGTLSYQWKKNGLAISGATLASLTLNTVVFADAAKYSVDVSDTSFTSLTSNVATLSVNSIKGGDLDFSFGNGISGATGFFGNNVVIALQSDGKVIIGGNFSKVNGVTRGGIARLNTDGSLDTSFGNGLAGVGSSSYNAPDVTAIALQSNGKVIIGGNFESVNGTNRSRVARLNSDGTLDTSFYSSSGELRALVLQPDGKFLVGGGSDRSQIARRNSDGSPDTSFGTGLAGTYAWGADVTGGRATVYATAIQGDGKVLIGGSFTTVNGVSRGGIARLGSNGAVDTAFGNGLVGISGTFTSVGYPTVRTCVVQGDGKLIVAGNFTQIHGITRKSIARLNSDGTLDTSFGNGQLGVDPSASYISSAAIQTDGKILIGGKFATVNGGVRRNIARLNADGTLDSTFGNSLAGAGSSSSSVSSVVLQGNGSVLIGGGFGTVNGTARGSIARLHSSEADADLAALTVNSVALSPSFNPGSISYAANLSLATSSVTVTPVLSNTNAIVRINGVVVASGDTSGPISLVAGSNIITTMVTAPDGSTVKTYTTTVTRADSSVATLSGISLSRGSLSPLFSSESSSYTASVVYSASEITVTPTVTDSTATVRVNGLVVASGSASAAVPLSVGNNAVAVTVTAQDGIVTRSYLITVTRAASAEATLSGVVLSSGSLNPVFSPNTTTYTASLGNASSAVTVTATATDAAATIKVNGVTVASGFASAPIDLSVGSNTINVVVTAQNNTTVVAYLFKLTRSESPQALIDWATAAGLSGPDSAPTAIPFNDGVENLLKYAFNMNAGGPDVRVLSAGGSSGLPQITVDSSGAEPVLKVAFLRRKGSGLTYTPQRSDTLGDFTAMTGTPTVTSIDAQWERVSVEEPALPATAPRAFARVQVTLP